MKLFETLVLICASVLSVSGRSCKCGGPKGYNRVGINRAVLMGNLQNPNPTLPFGPYPHKFNNHEGFSFPWCEADGNTLAEYPLMHGNVYFNTEAPGADRIIYINGTNTPCGCVTHLRQGTSAIGEFTGDFIACEHRD
ncbi:Ribonuclease/ribotoxin, partial [Infundibulicybe gibba]